MGLLIVLGGMAGGVDCCVSWVCFFDLLFWGLVCVLFAWWAYSVYLFNVGFLACCWFVLLWVLIFDVEVWLLVFSTLLVVWCLLVLFVCWWGWFWVVAIVGGWQLVLWLGGFVLFCFLFVWLLVVGCVAWACMVILDGFGVMWICLG